MQGNVCVWFQWYSWTRWYSIILVARMILIVGKSSNSLLTFNDDRFQIVPNQSFCLLIVRCVQRSVINVCVCVGDRWHSKRFLATITAGLWQISNSSNSIEHYLCSSSLHSELSRLLACRWSVDLHWTETSNLCVQCQIRDSDRHASDHQCADWHLRDLAGRRSSVRSVLRLRITVDCQSDNITRLRSSIQHVSVELRKQDLHRNTDDPLQSIGSSNQRLRYQTRPCRNEKIVSLHRHGHRPDSHDIRDTHGSISSFTDHHEWYIERRKYCCLIIGHSLLLE